METKCFWTISIVTLTGIVSAAPNQVGGTAFTGVPGTSADITLGIPWLFDSQEQALIHFNTLAVSYGAPPLLADEAPATPRDRGRTIASQNGSMATIACVSVNQKSPDSGL